MWGLAPTSGGTRKSQFISAMASVGVIQIHRWPWSRRPMRVFELEENGQSRNQISSGPILRVGPFVGKIELKMDDCLDRRHD
jgi:hypothetical protein